MQWSLSTRDKFACSGASLQGTSLQWSLSTRDKFGDGSFVPCTVEPLYKGQVWGWVLCPLYSRASLQRVLCPLERGCPLHGGNKCTITMVLSHGLCSEVVLFTEVTNYGTITNVLSLWPLFRGCPLLRGIMRFPCTHMSVGSHRQDYTGTRTLPVRKL